MSDEKVYSEFEQTRMSHRPSQMGRKHMVVSGQALASQAGMRILEQGGNAVDAMVAAGLCLCVVQSDMVNFAGVAPLMIHMAGTGEPVTVSGLGPWPRAASVDYFLDNHDGLIPPGLARTVVPGSPDSWIRALRLFGTMSFDHVSRDARELAANGFPMHRFLSNSLQELADDYRRWHSNAEIYLPDGLPPKTGEIFIQKDLAQTIERMVRAERDSQSSGRDQALKAANDEFYKGGIARQIADYYQANHGLLTYEDLASYKSEVEKPLKIEYGSFTVYSCQPWCQGPVLLQMLNLLEPMDLKVLGHNTADYIHTLVEAMKLSFADRHAYYGDPDFVEVPIAGLLSKAYARERAGLIQPGRAWPEMPPPGDPWKSQPGHTTGEKPAKQRPLPNIQPNNQLDTSYVCAVDKWGNCASAVPSDMSFSAPVVPGTGIVVSTRGSQSWVEHNHPSSIEGGKRPRLTPTPFMVFKDGKPYLVMGTPGGDTQCQTILQVFLNLVLFDMEPQMAVEAPRFATFSQPNSFYPHDYHPGLMRIERRIPSGTIDSLKAKGHKVEQWPDWAWKAGGACLIRLDQENEVFTAGADPRRESYAVGW